MNSRELHIFVTDFILSGRTPGELLAEKRPEEAQAVLEYVRKGPPLSMAMTDPSLFTRLRDAITQLALGGWY